MKEKMRVILATRNEHKVEEINPILSEFGMKAVSLNDLSLCDVEVIEDGETFEANSYKKAFEEQSDGLRVHERRARPPRRFCKCSRLYHHIRCGVREIYP